MGRFCGQCGKELEEGCKFCGNCGAPVNSESTSDELQRGILKEQDNGHTVASVEPQENVLKKQANDFLQKFGIRKLSKEKIVTAVFLLVSVSLMIFMFCYRNYKEQHISMTIDEFAKTCFSDINKDTPQERAFNFNEKYKGKNIELTGMPFQLIRGQYGDIMGVILSETKSDNGDMCAIAVKLKDSKQAGKLHINIGNMDIVTSGYIRARGKFEEYRITEQNHKPGRFIHTVIIQDGELLE